MLTIKSNANRAGRAPWLLIMVKRIAGLIAQTLITILTLRHGSAKPALLEKLSIKLISSAIRAQSIALHAIKIHQLKKQNAQDVLQAMF